MEGSMLLNLFILIFTRMKLTLTACAVQLLYPLLTKNNTIKRKKKFFQHLKIIYFSISAFTKKATTATSQVKT